MEENAVDKYMGGINENFQPFSTAFSEGFILSAEEAKRINPVTLAFVGDAVYSLYVRARLVKAGGGKAADYQRAAAKIVSAHGQSDFLEKVLPCLTEEEAEIFRRGRNAKKATKSKNASVGDYNRSTGFEALIGFLYLSGRQVRIAELFALDSAENYKIESAAGCYKP